MQFVMIKMQIITQLYLINIEIKLLLGLPFGQSICNHIPKALQNSLSRSHKFPQMTISVTNSCLNRSLECSKITDEVSYLILL